MGLEAISFSASIALICAMLVLILVETARAAALPLIRNSLFSKSIMIEAAQRFRDELRRLSGEKTVYVTGNLVFFATFAVAVFLNPNQFFADLPIWQHLLILMLGVVSFIYLIYRLSTVAIEARRVTFVRDANIAIGHSLQKLTDNQNRTFHDVLCESGYVDHVLVGRHGIYAVKVVAKRPAKDNRVRIKDDMLMFAPGKEWESLEDFTLMVRQLSVQFRKELGKEVVIRKVIAVPGWEIDIQESDEYLVVNERNLTMIRGWKDVSDHLMNEDVETLQGYLAEVSLRANVRKPRLRFLPKRYAPG